MNVLLKVYAFVGGFSERACIAELARATLNKRFTTRLQNCRPSTVHYRKKLPNRRVFACEKTGLKALLM